MTGTTSSTSPTLCCEPLLTQTINETEAHEVASILKALADPIRVRLVSVISTSPTGEICACDLPELFARSQPTMSHHLSILTKAGILEREQRGKWAWFRVVPERLAHVASVLEAPA